ncbi:hypothetical protein BH10PSE19_BH10PSE19_15080 [soil metagenome]
MSFGYTAPPSSSSRLSGAIAAPSAPVRAVSPSSTAAAGGAAQPERKEEKKGTGDQVVVAPDRSIGVGSHVTSPVILEEWERAIQIKKETVTLLEAELKSLYGLWGVKAITLHWSGSYDGKVIFHYPIGYKDVADAFVHELTMLQGVKATRFLATNSPPGLRQFPQDYLSELHADSDASKPRAKYIDISKLPIQFPDPSQRCYNVSFDDPNFKILKQLAVDIKKDPKPVPTADVSDRGWSQVEYAEWIEELCWLKFGIHRRIDICDASEGFIISGDCGNDIDDTLPCKLQKCLSQMSMSPVILHKSVGNGSWSIELSSSMKDHRGRVDFNKVCTLLEELPDRQAALAARSSASASSSSSSSSSSSAVHGAGSSGELKWTPPFQCQLGKSESPLVQLHFNSQTDADKFSRIIHKEFKCHAKDIPTLHKQARQDDPKNSKAPWIIRLTQKEYNAVIGYRNNFYKVPMVWSKSSAASYPAPKSPVPDSSAATVVQPPRQACILQ